jgi:hypothetical protein
MRVNNGERALAYRSGRAENRDTFHGWATWRYRTNP